MKRPLAVVKLMATVTLAQTPSPVPVKRSLLIHVTKALLRKATADRSSWPATPSN